MVGTKFCSPAIQPTLKELLDQALDKAASVANFVRPKQTKDLSPKDISVFLKANVRYFKHGVNLLLDQWRTFAASSVKLERIEFDQAQQAGLAKSKLSKLDGSNDVLQPVVIRVPSRSPQSHVVTSELINASIEQSSELAAASNTSLISMDSVIDRSLTDTNSSVSTLQEHAPASFEKISLEQWIQFFDNTEKPLGCVWGGIDTCADANFLLHDEAVNLSLLIEDVSTDGQKFKLADHNEIYVHKCVRIDVRLAEGQNIHKNVLFFLVKALPNELQALVGIISAKKMGIVLVADKKILPFQEEKGKGLFYPLASKACIDRQSNLRCRTRKSSSGSKR